MRLSKEYNHKDKKCIQSTHDTEGMLPMVVFQLYKDLKRNSFITKIGCLTG